MLVAEGAATTERPVHRCIFGERDHDVVAGKSGADGAIRDPPKQVFLLIDRATLKKQNLDDRGVRRAREVGEGRVDEHHFPRVGRNELKSVVGRHAAGLDKTFVRGVGKGANFGRRQMGRNGNAGEGHGGGLRVSGTSVLFVLGMEINLTFEKHSYQKVMNMLMHPMSDLAVFVRTVDLGSFAAVGTEVELTASGVSRIVTRLERRIGAKLLHRTTRRLVLTQEGETFLVHARGILAAVEAAEADVASVHGRPRGHLRINSGTAFARHRLARLLPPFMDQFPEITVDLSVSDHRIDPIADQVDVTIRVGPLGDSELIAVRLGEVRRVIAGSPRYLERHGVPAQAADLARHNCLQLSGFSRLAQWPMFEQGKRVLVPVKGSIRSDSADFLLDLALAGAGLVRFGDFLGEDAVKDGRLVPVLSHCHDPDPQPITALILPGRQNIPRVRAFVDFLKAGV